MNHINDKDKELMIRQRIANKDSNIEIWLKEERDNRSNFTEDQIKFLGILAEKNLKYLSNKQALTDPQRQMKTSIHKYMRNTVLDLSRMVNYGFIGPESYWNPISWGGKDSPPFDDKVIKNCFPSYDISILIEALVGMFGDEYAIPIANGIEKGLRKSEGWDTSYEIEVPVIRKAKKSI